MQIPVNLLWKSSLNTANLKYRCIYFSFRILMHRVRYALINHDTQIFYYIFLKRGMFVVQFEECKSARIKKIISLHCTYQEIFSKTFIIWRTCILHNDYLKYIKVHGIETFNIPRSMSHNVGLSRSVSINVIWGLKKTFDLYSVFL